MQDLVSPRQYEDPYTGKVRYLEGGFDFCQRCKKRCKKDNVICRRCHEKEQGGQIQKRKCGRYSK